MPQTEAIYEGKSPKLGYALILYFGLVAVAWLINYPGRLNPDSYDMLAQAQDIGRLTDWHAPAVTWLWSVFTPAFGQPAGALFAQSLLIFVYPTVWWVTRDHPEAPVGAARTAFSIGYSVLLLALIPLTGQVEKDQVLIGLLMSLLAIVHLQSVFASSASLRCWLCYIPITAMILLVRPSNFIIMGLCGITAGYFIFGRSRRYAIIVLAIVGGCIVAVPLTSLANRAVFGAKNAMAERSLIIFDMAGISTRVKTDLFAELPDWPTDRVPRPWECYTPSAWDPFAWGGCKEYSGLVAARMEKFGTVPIVRWWLDAILSHPYFYIKHRLSFVAHLIVDHLPIVERVGAPPEASNSSDSAWGPVISERYGVDLSRSLQAWEPSVRYRPFQLVPALVFSTPFIIGALFSCVVTLIYSWRRMGTDRTKLDMVVVVSSAIGIGNLVMQLPFGVANAGRYLVPTVICGGISLLRMVQNEFG